MGTVEDIQLWRARRAAARDVPMGSPPFVLEEPCPGCGARRVGTMVWRWMAGEPETGEATAAIGSLDERPMAFPRIAPHFLCHEGRVIHQEITDSPEPMSSWTRIFGRFAESSADPADPAAAR